MNKIELNNLQLKIFTEQDALDYCQINNINPENIIELNLGNNELKNISGIKLFKNLKRLYLYNNKLTDISEVKLFKNLKLLSIGINKITDISVLKDLTELENLYIQDLRLNSDQIKYIKLLKKLKELWCYNGFKDMSILNQLNKNIEIY